MNRRPPTRSREGTYGLLRFQCSTQTDPNSTIFFIFSVRTCTAPYTRTCNFSDPGGLVAHGFQFFEQEVPYQIDNRYLSPSPVSILNLNGPKLHLLRHFSVRTCTAPHTRTCNFSDPGGLVAHGFQLFERKTPCPIDSRYLCPSPVSTLNLNGPKLHLFCHFFGINLHCPTHTHM